GGVAELLAGAVDVLLSKVVDGPGKDGSTAEGGGGGATGSSTVLAGSIAFTGLSAGSLVTAGSVKGGLSGEGFVGNGMSPGNSVWSLPAFAWMFASGEGGSGLVVEGTSLESSCATLDDGFSRSLIATTAPTRHRNEHDTTKPALVSRVIFLF